MFDDWQRTWTRLGNLSNSGTSASVSVLGYLNSTCVIFSFVNSRTPYVFIGMLRPTARSLAISGVSMIFKGGYGFSANLGGPAWFGAGAEVGFDSHPENRRRHP